jgi:hypothetical protein
MINKIWNWIKNIFKPERQDPHLEMYEETRTDKQKKYVENIKEIMAGFTYATLVTAN